MSTPTFTAVTATTPAGTRVRNRFTGKVGTLTQHHFATAEFDTHTVAVRMDFDQEEWSGTLAAFELVTPRPMAGSGATGVDHFQLGQLTGTQELGEHSHHISGSDVACDTLTHCPSLCDCPVDDCCAVPVVSLEELREQGRLERNRQQAAGFRMATARAAARRPDSRAARCDQEARHGVCDTQLDAHGQCPRAAMHTQAGAL